jgi:hypothetical protein
MVRQIAPSMVRKTVTTRLGRPFPPTLSSIHNPSKRPAEAGSKLRFDNEDGSDTFLQNIGLLVTTVGTSNSLLLLFQPVFETLTIQH